MIDRNQQLTPWGRQRLTTLEKVLGQSTQHRKALADRLELVRSLPGFGLSTVSAAMQADDANETRYRARMIVRTERVARHLFDFLGRRGVLLQARQAGLTKSDE